jgi:hypothetical protein
MTKWVRHYSVSGSAPRALTPSLMANEVKPSRPSPQEEALRLRLAMTTMAIVDSVCQGPHDEGPQKLVPVTEKEIHIVAGHIRGIPLECLPAMLIHSDATPVFPVFLRSADVQDQALQFSGKHGSSGPGEISHYDADLAPLTAEHFPELLDTYGAGLLGLGVIWQAILRKNIRLRRFRRWMLSVRTRRITCDQPWPWRRACRASAQVAWQFELHCP